MRVVVMSCRSAPLAGGAISGLGQGGSIPAEEVHQPGRRCWRIAAGQVPACQHHAQDSEPGREHGATAPALGALVGALLSSA